MTENPMSAAPWRKPSRWTETMQGRDLISRAAGPAVPMPIKMPSVAIRPVSLAYVPRDREEYCGCQYDLGEIARASDTEMMIARSFTKHAALCMKEGWKLVGKNPRAVGYIRKRLFEFQLGTSISTDELLTGVTKNIVAYGNAFLVFRRDNSMSSGRPITKKGRNLEPIAGMFLADPTSMNIRRNRWGEVKGYNQIINGDDYIDYNSKFFSPEDVVHIKYDDKTGFAWGTPFVVPSLDDIRLLRGMEELANLTAHKATFPIIHWKVGMKEKPAIDYQDGTSEITDVENDLMGRDSEGVFVTSERHDIELKEMKPTDVTKSLKYFQNRAMTGLNLSTVDMGVGDTANRGTATEMSKGLILQCKAFQGPISCGMTSIFDDLLEEGGFPINEENRVHLHFPEIDIETQQIVHNHAMALYQGHGITESEMRMKMGLEPLTDPERESMFLDTVEIPKLDASAKAKAAAAPAPAVNATANRNQPSNQSGTKGARGRTKNDLIEHRLRGLFSALLDNFQQSFPDQCDVDRRVAGLVLHTVEGLTQTDESAFVFQQCLLLKKMRQDTIKQTLHFIHCQLLRVLT